MALHSGIVKALADIVGQHHVRLTPGDGAGLRAPLPEKPPCPDAIVYPGSTSELAELLRGASACDIAVHTSDGILLDGDSGHIVLSQKRFNRILDIDRYQLTCRLQPEVPLQYLNQTLAAAGLTIASVSCAAEPRSTVANAVGALTVVSSTGTVVGANRVAHDDHVDLVDLLMRMAGTSCVLTELTVALTPTSP